MNVTFRGKFTKLENGFGVFLDSEWKEEDTVMCLWPFSDKKESRHLIIWTKTEQPFDKVTIKFWQPLVTSFYMWSLCSVSFLNDTW